MLLLQSWKCYGKVPISSQFKLNPGRCLRVTEIKAAPQNSQDLSAVFFPLVAVLCLNRCLVWVLLFIWKAEGTDQAPSVTWILKACFFCFLHFHICDVSKWSIYSLKKCRRIRPVKVTTGSAKFGKFLELNEALRILHGQLFPWHSDGNQDMLESSWLSER